MRFWPTFFPNILYLDFVWIVLYFILLWNWCLWVVWLDAWNKMPTKPKCLDNGTHRTRTIWHCTRNKKDESNLQYRQAVVPIPRQRRIFLLQKNGKELHKIILYLQGHSYSYCFSFHFKHDEIRWNISSITSTTNCNISTTVIEVY